MLCALSIRDFVLIDRLDLSPSQGFTCITGETGAGKSIILDALGLVLGDKPDRQAVRVNAEQAVVSASFSLPPNHAAWAEIRAAGFEACAEDVLVVRRVVPRNGPARGFLNDQPASSAVLARIGALLVEIHAQHAATGLFKSSTHRALLDRFAVAEALVAKCATTWTALVEARERRAALAETATSAQDERDWIRDALQELTALDAQVGEAAHLAQRRAAGQLGERFAQAVDEAASALGDDIPEAALAGAIRAVERLRRRPEGDATQPDEITDTVTAAEAALERALAETQEAREQVAALKHILDFDPDAHEALEARWFALRGAARKYDVCPDELPDLRLSLEARLADMETGAGDLEAAARRVEAAEADWRSACAALTAKRRDAAQHLAHRVGQELGHLKLGGLKFRVGFRDLKPDEPGAAGAERVEFEIAPNPGAGFGPLRQIASGGELARLSLAIRCALTEAAACGVLVFDEADQGVGGAVAAAIGERLVRLGAGAQVFAITHSPQVAACANDQWVIEKDIDPEGLGRTRARALNRPSRREELARMLSGAEVTREARAAAERLLEGV